jgi:uncharacterized protein YjiK
LQKILSHRELTPDLGFRDPEVKNKKLDVSGLCYDSRRDKLWIVSDEAKRVFLFDLSENKVVQSFSLGYTRKGKYREIEKAEGIALDPESDHLYIVCDEEAQLYTFDIRE